MDRSTAPGLQQGCTDKPGNRLARRPNAPLELLCAFALPSGDKIQSVTKTWVEGGRLYVTELGNGALYAWDATDHSPIAKVPGFVGSTGVAATSGPNSLTLSDDGHAWVSDGISAVRVVDLASMSIVATISTAIPACGTTCQRTNEITYDPEHHIIFVQNPTPLSGGTAIDTYGTFISSDPPYNILGTITFANRRGQEAPLWDPGQHRIVTTVSGRLGTGTTVYHQYVALIDPTFTPFTVDKEFDVDCTALGLTGTGGARLFGINDPALGPDEKMVLPGCGRALIMNAATGEISNIMPVAGGNETTYNPGDGNFYVAGANFSTDPAGPNSLGVIQAATSTMLQYIPALGAANPAASFDNNTNNNEVFAPVAGNASTTATTACTPFGLQASGCILVFAHVPGSGD